MQITSAIILVNGIIPQHMYEGIRIFASVVFYQVPAWEKSAENSRYILNSPIKDLIKQTLNSYYALFT